MTDETTLVVKNRTYHLQKTRGNKLIAEILYKDTDNNGFDRGDSVVVRGNSKAFTADEIKENLFKNYQNDNVSGKAETGANYKKRDDKFIFEQNKRISMGSLFDAVTSSAPPAPVKSNKGTGANQNTDAGTSKNSNPVDSLNNFVNNPGSMPSPYATGEALNVYNSAYRSGMASVGGGFFNMGAFANMYNSISNYVDKMFSGQNSGATNTSNTSTGATGATPTFGGATEATSADTTGSTGSGSSKASADFGSEDVGETYSSGRHHHRGSSFDSANFDEAKPKTVTYKNAAGYTIKKTVDKNGNTVCYFSKGDKHFKRTYYKNGGNEVLYANGSKHVFMKNGETRWLVNKNGKRVMYRYGKDKVLYGKVSYDSKTDYTIKNYGKTTSKVHINKDHSKVVTEYDKNNVRTKASYYDKNGHLVKTYKFIPKSALKSNCADVPE